MVTWARERKTLILPLILGHHHLPLQLHLPKFHVCCFSLELRQSWCCQYNVWIKSLKVQTLQVCSLLVVDVSNLCLGGLRIAFLVFIAHDPASRSPHVNCCLPFPPWLQLLMIFLVVVILILVVWILHLLCFHLLQLFATFLVVVFMLIVVFFLLLSYKALLMTLLVVVILISVVLVLHFLCLHFLQVLATLLVIVLMLVIVLFLLLFSCSW